jgi:hypothetical protein
VQKYFCDRSFFHFSDHSVAGLIDEPASDGATENHDGILWLMQKRRDKEENREEVESFDRCLQVGDEVDDKQSAHVHPE